jgi:nucleotide-binding universal stress UspA family protein
MNDSDSARPILVPVDFSAPSEAALLWAVEHARAAGAQVVVLHVVHDPAEAPGYYLSTREIEGTEMRRLEEAAREMMDAFLARVCEQRPEAGPASAFATKLVVGVPATRILEVAEELGAGSIVMGSAGRTGWTRALLGSKAERVVRLSPIPVTIVKADADA